MEELSNEIIWLIAGVLLVLAEFAILPAVGMLFAGVSALVVGLILGFSYIDLIAQWAIFLGLTTILSVLFFKKLKNFRSNNKATEFKHMVGDSVYVIGKLEAGRIGKVKWSGTIMRAKSEHNLSDGAVATIVALDGNILLVK